MLPRSMPPNLKFRLRLAPFRLAEDVGVAGAYSMSATFFAQSAEDIGTVEVKLRVPVAVAKSQLSIPTGRGLL